MVERILRGQVQDGTGDEYVEGLGGGLCQVVVLQNKIFKYFDQIPPFYIFFSEKKINLIQSTFFPLGTYLRKYDSNEYIKKSIKRTYRCVKVVIVNNFRRRNRSLACNVFVQCALLLNCALLRLLAIHAVFIIAKMLYFIAVNVIFIAYNVRCKMYFI